MSQSFFLVGLVPKPLDNLVGSSVCYSHLTLSLLRVKIAAFVVI